ncbi:MAG: tRNA lysidine(34) synthetase TilS [Phycisphaerales bacterium]|nr:tRNA lysidine(34) synthetase TilS [Phycisphaerales bacterium]
MSVTNARKLVLPSHRERGVAAIGRALRERCGVRAGSRLILAVSGGADSAALLLAVAALAQRREHAYTLTVGHVEHGLRGAESSADAEAVTEWCEELGIPCEVIDVDVLAEVPANTEAAARSARYAALGELARRDGATAVVVGHHEQDQLETVLMALLRGAGPRGMAGMAWRRPLSPGVPLVRPMLAVDHRWAVGCCRTAGLAWREDRTNRDLSRTRAAVRADLVPIIERMRPGTARRLVDAAPLWRAAAELVTEAADDAMGEADAWRRDDLRLLDPAVLAEGLRRRATALLGGDGEDQLTGRKLTQCADAIRDGSTEPRRLHLAGRLWVQVTAHLVTLRTDADVPDSDGER